VTKLGFSTLQHGWSHGWLTSAMQQPGGKITKVSFGGLFGEAMLDLTKKILAGWWFGTWISCDFMTSQSYWE